MNFSKNNNNSVINYVYRDPNRPNNDL